jgi:nucleotide-binding universal stress UspA family protein
MKRFKNILFFADGVTEDSPALRRAYDLAIANHARLTVIDVIDGYDADPQLEERLGIRVSQLLRDNHLAAMSTMVSAYQSEDQMIYTQVMTGTPFIEIIRAVMRNGYDLVIKAAHTAPGFSERLLGSTDMHLLRKCPCPVWIERPGKPIPYQNVLAAVDPVSDASTGRLVMDLASSLSRRDTASLSVIHSWHLPGETMLRSGRSRLSNNEVDHIVELEKTRHESSVNALLLDYDLSTAHPDVHLVQGRAAQSIIHYGEKADVIVMGTVARSGIPGLIIGNTAEEVMQATQASILAVKPDGFISPVS